MHTSISEHDTVAVDPASQIRYEERGTGRPLLLLHGLAVDHHSLEPLDAVAEAAGSWRRILIDLPGMGRSADLSGIRSVQDVYDRLKRFVSSVIGEERFALCGYSLGGLLGAALAVHRPLQVAGLFLLAPETVALTEHRALPAPRVFADGTLDLGSLTEQQREFFEGTAAVYSADSWKRFAANILPGLLAADWQTVGALSEHPLLDSDPFASIDSFTAPISVALGREDVMVGYADALAVFRDHPTATITIHHPAGHALQTDQPDAVASQFHHWLTSLSAEGRSN